MTLPSAPSIIFDKLIPGNTKHGIAWARGGFGG